MTDLAVNGATLWVEEAGDGPAVVLLHGSLGDSHLWDKQFDSLAERFRTIRYDHRFFGRSEAPDAPYSLVDDARGVLDALAIDRAALVGLSLRGRIAIDATLLYPERVWALVPVCAGLSGFDLDGVYSPEQETEFEAAVERGDDETAAEIDLTVWASPRRSTARCSSSSRPQPAVELDHRHGHRVRRRVRPR